MRTAWYVAVSGALLAVAASGLPAEPAGLELRVTGVAKGVDGRWFAVLRGIGVVKEGDYVPVSTESMSCRLRILAVGPAGVKVEARDVVRKEHAAPPAPAAKPRRPDELRDPFWPVGYSPA